MNSFIVPVPYTIRKQYAPTIMTSTGVDSTTICAQSVGRDSYVVSIECTTGEMVYNAVGGTASPTVGSHIYEKEVHTFLVVKNDLNPTGCVSLFGTSTTAQYQAWIFE